jgi:hypothetical protein
MWWLAGVRVVERNELEFPGMSRDPQTEEYAYCWCRVILFSL